MKTILQRLAICFVVCLFSALAHAQGTTLNGPVTILPAVGQSPTSTISFTSATDALPCISVVKPSVADPSLCFDSSGNLTVDIGGGPVILGKQGAPGVNGANGKDGAAGQAATISVGTVTTLPAGSPATVSNSGTSSAAVFSFGIPQGANGTTATNKIPATFSCKAPTQSHGIWTFTGCK